MMTPLIVVVTAVLEYWASSTVEGAGAAAGANAQTYAKLCTSVAALITPYSGAEPAAINTDILADALALNFSLNHPQATNEPNEPTATERKKLPKTGEATKLTTDETFGEIRARAQAAAALAKSKQFAKVQPTPQNADLVHTAISVITEIATTADKATNIKPEQATQEANRLLNQALYGVDTPDDSIKIAISAGGKTRIKLCGQTGNANDDSQAGSSLKHDIMCVCGVHTDTGGTAACATFSAALSVKAEDDTELKPDWIKLKERCKQLSKPTRPTAAGLRAAAAAATSYIAASASADGKYSHLLGKTTDHANTGCSGDDTAGNGPCVYYGRQTADAINFPVQWIEHMLQAAEKISEAENQARQRTTLAERLTELNRTLAATAVAAMKRPSVLHTNGGVQAHAPAGKKKEQMCHELKSPEQCATNDNCRYDKDKPEEPKCVLSDKGKQAAEKEAETQVGKDGKTDSRCSKHTKNGDCKSSDCMWEGKTSKDSSFLLNNKLALIAAFVSSLAF
uniref:Variant surface glycoprotein 428 n=1 Tax=Trypanosoma brucei TaxID=5691 RepID=M4T1P8_9TRYP|nr:variant surface glycoprotein 428 [Trypanosoma brucei]